MMDGREVTAGFAVAYIAHIGGTRTLTVDQIRQWCHRDKVARLGTHRDRNGHRYATYDLNDIIARCIELGYLPDESQVCHSVCGEACPDDGG